jgi:hypothetical protein
MVIGAPAALSTNRGSGDVVYEAVLGLGVNSVLWSYWDRFTLSATTLSLGAFDMSVPRVSSHLGVASHFVPSWMYTVSGIDTLGFQVPLHAQLHPDDAAAVRAACIHTASVASVNEIAALRDTDPLVAALLHGARNHADASCCDTPANYTVMLLPHSEFNIVPAQLSRYAGGGLRFRAHSDRQDDATRHLCATVHGDSAVLCRSDAHSEPVTLPLVDVCRDRYHSAAAGSLSMSASRIAQLNDSVLIVGAPALRKLVWMYHIGTGISFLMTPYDYGVQFRAYGSLLMFVSLLLWAMWVSAIHPLMGTRALSVAQARALLAPIRAPKRRVPDAMDITIRQQQQPVIAASVVVPAMKSDSGFGDIRRIVFGVSVDKATASAAPKITPVESPKQSPAAPTPPPRVKLFALQLSHWLLATLLVHATWQWRTLRVMHLVRGFTDAIVALQVLIAVVYFDAPRFVAHIIDLERGAGVHVDDMFRAQCVVGTVIVALTLCSVLAQLMPRSQARLANLLQQLEVLLAAWLVFVPLHSRSVALFLLLLVGQLALFVGIAIGAQLIELRRTLAWFAAVALVCALSAFAVLLNWRVVIDRLWDDHPMDLLLSTIACAFVSIPIALITFTYEDSYTLRVLTTRFRVMGVSDTPPSSSSLKPPNRRQ